MLSDFDHKAVFFGLQGFLNEYIDLWNESFFNQSKQDVLVRIADMQTTALDTSDPKIDHWAALHDLGYLPLHIKALPEGSRVDMRVPMLTVCNTLPEFYWLTNFIETPLSSNLWKMITNATIAREYKRLLTNFAEVTGSDPALVPFQGHDFSMRGMSGWEDAARSGAAHLLSFNGTDSIPAIDYIEDYYMDEGQTLAGSVPATEHSVMCMGGEEDEIETFRRLIEDVYPTGIVSIVSDTWDFWKVICDYAVQLKDKIESRQGKVVFRPDSGDPVKIICGDPDATPGSPASLGAVNCLWNIFGGFTNEKGYRVLNSHVGLIYGDSITLQIAEQILLRLAAMGYASSAIVFGIGSFTYQHVTRDTFGSAIKATYGIVDGQERAICKAPKTDSGMKNSARGLLRVEFENGKYVLYENQTPEQEKTGLLQTVFENGRQFIEDFTTIRARLAGSK